MTLKVEAEIRQLRTDHTFVNVLRGLEGGIGLWGHAYKCPTYLLLVGDNWIIVTYDSEEWRDESLKELARTWVADKVFEIPTLEEVKV